MAGISLEREIFEISQKPEKCIDYSIGSKFEQFVREQGNEPNFIETASGIASTAIIYCYKVDHLTQSGYELSGNLSMYLETGNDTPKNGNDTPKTGKKTRVKKFLIKDKVIIFQISFEEKNINIQEKQNINKTLTMPRILSKMRKMKQFYAKNKENNGKLAMPKSCQLLNDRAGKSTTFGSDLIYDYDQSDVVGSRKDFASHCHIIDPYSGELLKDLNFNNSESIQNIQENETHRINQHADFMSDNETSFTPTISNDENSILRNCEANNSYLTLCNPDSSILPEQQSCASIMSQLSINLDEGIDVSDPLDLLLASPKLTINILKLTTSPEMIECYLNTKRKMEDSNSLLTRSFYETRDRILNSPSEFVLPLQIQSTVADSRLRNILMIPVQKLKHKCAFDLPGSEFFMYKKMKMNQHKSTVEDATTKRMFKTIDCCNAGEIIRECSVALDSPPCFGFSQDELEESLQTVHVITPLELLIKSENDVLRARSRSRTPSETLCPHRNSSDSYDSGIGSTTIGNDSNNLTNTMTDFGEDLDRTRKTDSCYQSMISGMSGTTGEVHEFMKSGPSSTPFDHNANDVDDDDEPSENVDHLLTHKPGTQIIEMQKLATNVARWRQYLKPVLDQAENRNHFDIHHYGSMIINKVDSISQTSTEVSFEDIVEVGEIPRYFLSMLQLINSGNLEIKKVSTGFLEPVLSSDIKIKVLSHVRHNEIVENIGAYLPSTIERLPLPKTSVSHKRKVSFDMCTSTPSIKKQAMQPCTSFSSQNISLPNNMADELFTSLTNSTITNESGYCSFETQNSQSMTN